MYNIFHAAGPESLVNCFQKGALLCQKVALNLWNVARAFEGLAYLAGK